MAKRPTLPAEEQNIITDAEHVKNMTESAGWALVKAKLDQRILDLQNIANLDMEKPDTLGIQLAARRMAVDEIWAWLKRDVYGFIEQAEANSKQDLPLGTDFIDRR